MEEALACDVAQQQEAQQVAQQHEVAQLVAKVAQQSPGGGQEVAQLADVARHAISLQALCQCA